MTGPNGQQLPPDDVKAIEEVVGRFFEGVVAVDGDTIWEVFSERARDYVLNIAIERGMEFDLGSRIRQGTANDEERSEYLTSLAEGIRYDLRGVDLDNLFLEMQPEPEDRDHIRVTYLVEVGTGTGLEQRIPAGSLILENGPEGWRILRLRPRPGP